MTMISGERILSLSATEITMMMMQMIPLMMMILFVPNRIISWIMSNEGEGCNLQSSLENHQCFHFEVHLRA